MDKFNIPKKVNRHVFNAILTLQTSHSGFVSAGLIHEHVKHQLRRSKHVENVDEVITQSLTNLTALGVLACTGSSEYAIRHTIRYLPEGNLAFPNSVSNVASSAEPNTALGRCELIKSISCCNSKPRLGHVRLNITNRLLNPVKRISLAKVKRSGRLLPRTRIISHRRVPLIMCTACRSTLNGLVNMCHEVPQNTSTDLNGIRKPTETILMDENFNAPTEQMDGKDVSMDELNNTHNFNCEDFTESD